MQPTENCRGIWDRLRQGYVAQRPQFPALRQPGSNYLQLDLGGKAAHYEWKILKAPRFHIEVALHFEGPSSEENISALALLDGRQATLWPTMPASFISGPWGRKWTRFGFNVEIDDPDNAVRQS